MGSICVFTFLPSKCISFAPGTFLRDGGGGVGAGGAATRALTPSPVIALWSAWCLQVTSLACLTLGWSALGGWRPLPADSMREGLKLEGSCCRNSSARTVWRNRFATTLLLYRKLTLHQEGQLWRGGVDPRPRDSGASVALILCGEVSRGPSGNWGSDTTQDSQGSQLVVSL